MKILNLYAGIGGNRNLWNELSKYIEVTAVEYDEEIAKVYKDIYKNDTVIIGDAKEYLLQHYKEFDFIWASPPCQTHSSIINSQYTRESYNAKYPDMSLYQIILFLQGHGRGCKWVIENVKPYYNPLIEPSIIIDRHLYWSNFNIDYIKIKKDYIIKYVTIKDAPCDMGDIKDKRQAIRNQVNPLIGKHILISAIDGYRNDKKQQ